MTSKTVIKLTIGLLMIHITAKYLSLNQIFKEVILDISGNDYFNQPSKGELGCL